MSQRYLPACIILLLVGACASAQTGNQSVVPRGDSLDTSSFVSDRLFFGRSIPEGGTVSDSAWTTFLAEVVTPYFPNGLTVWRGEGQWRDPGGKQVQEQVMVVEVLHPVKLPPDSVFESIARIYRTRFRQDAVLRATGPVRMLLYEAKR